MVDFAVSDEQEELRRSVRRFLADKSPSSEVRRLMATDEGYDPAVWTQMAEQLGLPGLAIPEELGGSGYTYVELAVVFEEAGAALLCSPLFATVGLAANALLSSDDDAAMKEYLPQIAAGELTATLAFTEDSGDWSAADTSTTATPAGDGWTLDGHKSFVVDGATAGLILVIANAPDGLSLFAVDRDAAGVERAALPTMDQTRKQARLTFAGTPARLIGTAGAGAGILARTSSLGCAALAAEATGGAQRCMDMAVDYAKARIQFGRPIGSFQAIKHKCSDMLVEVESARSAAYFAASEAADNSPDLATAASLAKAYCTDAFFHTAAENIQVHGGIGFTWEHDAHLYFKRAKSSQLMLGDPASHREFIAQQIGI
ncbi:MAG: acyl-CoA/acyl-ACP dehydrogenase [Frankiaceae bacterium]|nr:acyl-CoA/acyl-ACP dehydrogenase [Frankiaceae bacterium]MBV9872654.1 acyl-CoA/acyl-ACP dehydrogenase [Frankiaceae bacterium]